MTQLGRTIATWAIAATVCVGGATSVADAQAAVPRRLATIGGEDNVGATLEGARDILVLNDRIVVVEGAGPFLKIFGLDGRLLQTAGRHGSGPGEIRHVGATAFDETRDELYVFDGRLGRVSRFLFRDTLLFRDSQILSMQALGACFSGDHLYATGLSPSDRVVHELSGDGTELRVVRSFGRAQLDHPNIENRMFRDLVADGPASCSSTTRRLILVSNQLGVAQIVSFDSLPQQTVRLGEFVPVEITAVPGRLTYRAPASMAFDQVIAVRQLDDVVSITVGRTDDERSGAGDYAGYREIVLEASGRQRIGPIRPWWTVHSSSARTICYRSSPEPEIAVFAGASCP